MSQIQALREWEATCAEQDWNDASKVSILLGFITKNGQLPQLAEFAQAAADAENGISEEAAFAIQTNEA